MLHPIVASMEPNDEQLRAILARGRDVVVTAGAGTGKTRTLVARYLALLAEGLPARSVVAVTYTRKAAHEMRNRVREAVRRYLERPDLPEEEWARWQALYAQLDAARIGTIHTLCAEMLRAHPVEARIDPGFGVLDEAEAGLLREQAVEAVLGWAAQQEDVAPLFGLGSERALREGLLRMVQARLTVADCRPTWASPTWADWEARLTAPIRAFVDDPAVRDACACLCALRDDGTLDRAATAGDGLAAPLAALLALWDAVLAAREGGDWGRVCGCLQPLRAAMRRNVGREGNWAPARPKDAIAVLQQRYDALVKPLAKDGGLDLGLDRRLMAAMPAVARLHARAVAAYDAQKGERRALDFDDLEQRALCLLQGEATVRARWQSEVRALLVDEFQDTNARQRDLLRLLNRPEGKLFVVGDAKQSIYAFRGADVTVFRQERVDVARHGGCVLSLNASYRAHGALVEGLNALLRPVLGAEADDCRPWVEPFAPLHAQRGEPVPGLSAPFIELHLAAGSKTDGALDRAADALAARLQELVDGRPGGSGDVGAERRLGYSDIAILCRASTSFAAYEDALDRAGIPYVTVAGRGFYERPEVRDVLNLLRALADPDDDLALAGALRSPAMGLSDAALYHLRHEQRGRGNAASLWDVLADAEAVPPDEASRARAALRCLRRLRQMVGRAAVADVIKRFYDDTDYLAALTAARQARGSRNLAKLLDDAHRSGLVGVGEFLAYVARLRDVGAREGEARTLSEEAVQIMSVHAAKGLEFPVVVIGDISHRRSTRDGLVIDPDLGPLLPVQGDEGRRPLAVRQARERLEDQEAAESGRLMYVAATRARELLILNGCAPLTADGLGSLGEWLGPAVSAGALALRDIARECHPEGVAVRRREVRIGEATAACCLYEPGWRPAMARRTGAERRATGALPNAALLGPIDACGTAADEPSREGERHPPRRVWRVVPAAEQRWAPSWVVGKIVHEALAAWRFDGDDFRAWAEARARHYGLIDRGRIDNACARARRLLQRLHGHHLFEEMAAARPRWHEVPYSLERDGRVEVGIIDVLYRWAGGWTILDVKTDRLHAVPEVDAWIERCGYAEQMARYRRAVERLLDEAPRVLLCFLDVAGAVHVVPLDG